MYVQPRSTGEPTDCDGAAERPKLIFLSIFFIVPCRLPPVLYFFQLSSSQRRYCLFFVWPLCYYLLSFVSRPLHVLHYIPVFMKMQREPGNTGRLRRSNAIIVYRHRVCGKSLAYRRTCFDSFRAYITTLLKCIYLQRRMER
jgi:hypothetical protein